MKTPTVLTTLSLLALVQGCGQAPAPSAAAATASPPDPLVFDTWVPGPCSPNGQPQGQCPPGELFRVRLVPVAEGLTNPRHVAFLPGGDLLIAELAGRVRRATLHVRLVRRSWTVRATFAGQGTARIVTIGLCFPRSSTRIRPAASSRLRA